MNHRIPQLDGLRAICITMVLVAHVDVFRNTQRPLVDQFVNDRLGAVGVTIFFVLSGFLITRLLAGEALSQGEISLRGFYWRRFWRILPAYGAFLMGLAFLAPPTGCQWATLLTFTKNFGCASDADIHIWSLSVEEQFYLTWPVLFALLTLRQRARLLGVVLLIWPLVRVAAHLFHYQFPWNGIAYYDAIAWGCAFGLLTVYRADLTTRVFAWRSALCRGLAWAVLLGAWQLQVSLKLAWLSVPLALSSLSAAAAFLIASYGTRGDVRWLASAPLVWLGRISYSVYLWQQLFLLAPSGLPAWLRVFPVNLCACLAVSALSYWWVEEPAQRFGRRQARRRMMPT